MAWGVVACCGWPNVLCGGRRDLFGITNVPGAAMLVFHAPMPQSLSYDSGLAWDNLTPGIAWDGFVTTPKLKRPMASDNRISLEITAAQKAAIVDAVMALKAALNGITINLTKEERQSLPKIGDKTLAFDEKCQAYMAARPELVPGFIDTHLHIESSLVTPYEFDRCVGPRGVTTAICDPHEIANVCGIPGIRYFLDSAAQLVMDLRVNLSSCVPSSHMETTGARLEAADLIPFEYTQEEDDGSTWTYTVTEDDWETLGQVALGAQQAAPSPSAVPSVPPASGPSTSPKKTAPPSPAPSSSSAPPPAL